MGFRGKPLTYNAYEDTNRAFNREIFLRILKGFDSSSASFLMSITEQKIVSWLGIDRFNLSSEK